MFTMFPCVFNSKEQSSHTCVETQLDRKVVTCKVIRQGKFLLLRILCVNIETSSFGRCL